MTPPEFRSRAKTGLPTLLQRILERLGADLPDALGLAIVVQKPTGTGTPVVVASTGVEADVIAAQVGGLGGPLMDALQYDVPVISMHLLSDDRWPALTRDAIADPDRADGFGDVVGAAALPVLGGQDSSVVLTCTLSRPATAATVTALMGYEQLVAAALIAGDAEADINDALQMMQSRSAIEQAKGAVMARLGCDSEHAWSTLRAASQTLNVKLRDLAVALLQHISDSPGETSEHPSPTVTAARNRYAAQQFWALLGESRE